MLEVKRDRGASHWAPAALEEAWPLSGPLQGLGDVPLGKAHSARPHILTPPFAALAPAAGAGELRAAIWTDTARDQAGQHLLP